MLEKHKNITPKDLGLLSWDSEEEKQSSIQIFYQSVQSHYTEVIRWYTHRKDEKQQRAKLLRAISIILTTIAATGLVVTAMCAGKSWAPNIGIVSSAILVISAGVVAFDRFFGYSSSWIRFILTSLILQKKLNGFQAQINALPVLLKNDTPDLILSAKMVTIMDAYRFLFDTMESEAHQWANEFQIGLDRTISEQIQALQNTK